LVDAVLPDQHLGEAALALAERASVLERLQQTDCFPEHLLRPRVVAFLLGGPGEGVQDAREHPGVAHLREELASLLEQRLGLPRVALVETEAPELVERVGARDDAAALAGELEPANDELLGLLQAVLEPVRVREIVERL